MDDILLLDTIERYKNGEMTSQENTFFEELRKNNPEIDQLVVEHNFFVAEVEKFGTQKSFKHTLHEVEAKMIDEGLISRPILTGGAKIVQVWSKYKRVASLAAGIAGIVSVLTIGLASIFNKTTNPDIDKLSRKVENLEKGQNKTVNELNEVKGKINKIDPNALPKSGGTGFLIDGKGYIITNAHVLKGNSAIVVNSDGEELKADIIYADKGLDLALLQINDEEFKQPKQLPFTIRKKKSDLGEEIFTLGYPRTDNDIVYGKGYLSAQSGFEGDSNAYQIQISANPGYSGAPVFNDNAELIGIISTRQKQAEGVAFAIKSKKIYDLVNTIKENESTKDVKIKLAKASSKLGKDRKSHISNFKNYIYSIKSYN